MLHRGSQAPTDVNAKTQWNCKAAEGGASFDHSENAPDETVIENVTLPESQVMPRIGAAGYPTVYFRLWPPPRRV
jgi:hypothetical protein